jgi:hypothetical protein
MFGLVEGIKYREGLNLPELRVTPGSTETKLLHVRRFLYDPSTTHDPVVCCTGLALRKGWILGVVKYHMESVVCMAAFPLKFHGDQLPVGN